MKLAKIVNIISILLLIIFLLSCLSGCFIFVKKEFVYGDFKYWDFGDTVEITGLSEEGMTKNILIIPREIDGKTVTCIERRTFFVYGAPSIWTSENLTKVYLYSRLEVYRSTFDECPLLKTIFIINPEHNYWGYGGLSYYSERITTYVFAEVFFEEYTDYAQVAPANVSYNYNYENSKNRGCFWLDNINAGEKIVDLPPDEPVREGYVFGGWYTEPECINKWDFENDVMPQSDEEFYELKLYAKWN